MVSKGHRFSFLLASVLTMVLVTPFLEQVEDDGFLLALVFLLALISVVFTATEILTRRIAILVAAGIWLVLRFATQLAGEPVFLSVAHIGYIGVASVSLYHVVRALIEANKVTVDILAGGIAVYLLFSIIWALGFSLMESLVPGSVFAVPDNHAQAWNQIYYFSLSSLTTLGYGDFVAASAFARNCAALESALGVIYLAVFMARLIGLLTHARMNIDN